MAAKKIISQSQTQWIKKGDKLSDGTVAKKGYVARKGNDTKKVTANVRLSASGDSANSKRLAGKKVGDVVKAQPGAKKSTTKGGGVTSAQAKAKAAAAAKSGGKTPAQLKAEAAAKEKAAAKAKAEAKKIAIDKARKADAAKRNSPGASGVKTTNLRDMKKIKDAKLAKASMIASRKETLSNNNKKPVSGGRTWISYNESGNPRKGDIRYVDERSGLGYLSDKNSNVKKIYDGNKWVKA